VAGKHSKLFVPPSQVGAPASLLLLVLLVLLLLLSVGSSKLNSWRHPVNNESIVNISSKRLMGPMFLRWRLRRKQSRLRRRYSSPMAPPSSANITWIAAMCGAAMVAACSLVNDFGEVDPGGTTAGGGTTSSGGSGGGAPLGEPCQSAAHCQSDLCADGVCCDQQCAGDCQACNLDDTVGSCSPQPAGTDPEGDCPDSNACSGTFVCSATEFWSKRFGDTQAEGADRVVVDHNDQVILSGTFSGTVDFGGGPLKSPGYSDIYLVKLDADGAHSWSKHYNGYDYSFGNALAVDAAGNVLLAGYFFGSISFGKNELVAAGGRDIFVTKHNPAGELIYALPFGEFAGESDQLAYGLAVDSFGNAIVVGGFLGELMFEVGNILVSNGSEDIFIAKLDGNGQPVFSKSFGDGERDTAHAVAVSASHRIAVVGSFKGQLDLGAGNLNASLGEDAFFAVFSSTGQLLWSSSMPLVNGNHARALDVAFDEKGDVIVVGYFEGQVAFGSESMTSAGQDDIFVAKLAADTGKVIWSRRFGDSASQRAHSVALDASGNIAVTGDFQGSVSFGPKQLTSVSDRDVFVVKLDSEGKQLWSRGYGGAGDQVGSSIASDSSGDLLVTGEFADTFDFGGASLASAGSIDVFVAKLRR